MLSTRRRRGWSGGRLGLLASGLAAALAAGSLVVAAPVTAAPICATPGGGGAGGTLTGVVNTYYPATTGSVAAGATSIPVGTPTGAATPIAAGDLLLVIQMQAADINSTNTDAYGDGVAGAPASGATSVGSSGLYEYVLATSGVVAGSVSITGTGPGAGLLNAYTQAAATATTGQRTFQVVRVPQFTTATTSSGLTAAAWNGSTGGVLALDTTSTLTLNGTVSVDGLGFRGGVGIRRSGGTGLANTDVAVSSSSGSGGTNGEGVAGTPSGVTTSNGYPGGDAARGAPANAGGGGTDGRPSANDENTGGGGGGNGGTGGLGGNSWNSNVARGGYGGVAIPSSASRALLGGGGGAGTGNDFTSPNSSGAPGGGIVLVRAGAVAGSGTISASGAAAYNTTANDGGGGGGAGGTIVLTSSSGSIAGATLVADGGRGGNAWATQGGASSAHGPGGGGGGGVILTSSAPTASSVQPGQNGITTTGNLVYGASPGTVGVTGTASPASIPGVSGGAECANLSITKTGPATVAAGGTLTYTLAVANAGPAAATSVSVLDTLPAGVTFQSATGTGWTCTNNASISVTCTRPSVASGASAPAITVTVTAPAQAGTATNTASVTSATPDPVPSDNTSTTSTTVTARADLSLVKTGPATVAANATVAYSLAVANAGPSDAASLTVSDTLPAGVTFVSATGTGWTCTNNLSISVTCTRPALAAGAAAPVITVTVTAPAQGATLTNVATVSSPTPDPVPGNNSSTTSTTVSPRADLAITKSGPATVAAGGSVTYTLGVSNAGPSDAASLVVTDTLPAGVAFVSATGTGWTCTNNLSVSVTCTRPSLATGASAPSITVVVTAPAQATTLANTASVASTTTDPNPANNTATASTTVTASADLRITKTGPASVTAGSSVTYTLTVSNAGPSDATLVSVLDSLPAGVTFSSATGTGWTCTNNLSVSVTCTRPTLASGATAPAITVVVTAPAQATTLSNTAAVSSATADPVPGNNTAGATTAVTASADLSITKAGPPTVTAAGQITYQLTVANAGPSDAAAVTVTDTLPAGTTFVSASAPAGWTCTNNASISVTCTRPVLAAPSSSQLITVVVTAPAQPASLTNSASVASTTNDPDPSNNSSSVSTDVTGSADLSIVKTGPATVVAGALVTYQLAVANAGPSDAVAVSVVDTLPAGVVFDSASGTGWTCTNNASVSVTCTRPGLAAGASAPGITVVVRAPDQATTLSNTASVSSTTDDPSTGDNTSTASTTVTASADVAITKSGPATVTAGSAVGYTLTVTNDGPSDAADVTVVDTLPPGVAWASTTAPGWTCTHVGDTSVTCSRATLAAGATSTITVVVDAPDQAAVLSNSATVASSTPDPVPGNNTGTAVTTVTASADLVMAKAGPASVVAGSSVTYTLTVTNRGPSDAADVSVVDVLPAGVSFVSASGSGWVCTHAGDVSVTCARPGLSAGASDTITVVVTAPVQATSITNTASVSSTTADPVPGNNTDTASTTVTASADLAITKAGPPVVTAGGQVSYALSVSNDGPSDASAVSVTDSLPLGVTFVSASGGGWTCTNVGDVSVTCTRPALATGATAPVITVVVQAPSQSATLVNTATVSSATPDPVPGNDTASSTATVTASADLSITKAGPPTVDASGTVTYTLVVRNAGPSDAASVVVTDTLPAGVAFGSATGSGWTCTATGDVSVSCALPSLAAGATASTITVVVTAPAQGGSLTNTATVSSATADPDLANNTSSVTTGVGALADLSITKSGPATVVAGGSVAYLLAVANAGPSDAADVTVTDTLPAGLVLVSATGSGWSCAAVASTVTCTRPSLATGTSAPLVTVVATAPDQPATLVNTAAVTSTTADPDTSNNADSASTDVTASADLALTKSGPLTVDAGASISYVLTVSSNGPSDAVGLSVTDTLPAGVSFVSASGSGWTCTAAGDVSVTCTTAALAAGATAPAITVVVTAPARGATLVNRASVTATTADPVPANNDASATTQVAGSADLSLVKSGPANVITGDRVSYSLVVRNDGPDDAVAVEVVDTLPAGVTFVSAAGSGWTCTNAGSVSVTCTLPSLADGATAPTITLVVRAPATAGSLLNTASASSATADPTPANNSSSAPTVVVPGGSGDNGDPGDPGNPGDNGDDGNGGDLPKTGATVPRDATAAVLLILLGAALVLVSRRRPGRL
ncbi:MAG: hypothetical protein U0S36_07540 [Candidatus Nanopelagicales bacterium]